MISLNVCFARPCRVRFGTTAAQGYTSRVWHKSTQTWGLLCANETDTAHRALSALNCNTVISRNVRRGPRAFPRGGCREGGNAGVAAFLLAAYHYRFTFIHGEQRPHVYVRVYVYIRVRACERPVYVLYVALYTNRKSEAITRYGTDKAGLALPRISLARLFKAYTYNIARRAVRPPIQRTYPRLELFLQ